jgi:hypothetical protein
MLPARQELGHSPDQAGSARYGAGQDRTVAVRAKTVRLVPLSPMPGKVGADCAVVSRHKP